MRILLTVEYDGKNFCGWQIQPEKRTVQGVLTDTLSSLFGEKITLHGSGRTDAGVHAANQKAHFDLKRDFPLEKIPYAVNTLLPPDVSVKRAEAVSDGFEAQFSAKKKTYRYDFYFSRTPRPLLDAHAARVVYDEARFDAEKAELALSLLVGTHDFTAFSSTGRPVKDATREIFAAKLLKRGELYSIEVTGNGFLYNMVRIIAGTVIEIGLGQLPTENVAAAFTSGNRALLGKTFPAHGLTLVDVEYGDSLR